MPVVSISSKFQIVIPREVRERLSLRPGDKLQAFLHEGRVELVPVRDVREMRGCLRGIDTEVERDEDRV